jgi:nitroreductase
MKVSDAVTTRKTMRAFRADPVPEETVREILRLAARAPSGGNVQPWRVHVLLGAARDELVARVAAARKDFPMGEAPEYHVYPPELTEPYRTRRFRVGEMMYATVNIPREDKPARIRFFSRNWQFFDAPVGLIFTMDRQMQQGQWADLGMYLQTIMLLAREHGLHTCPQEAWAVWHRVIRSYLDVPENEMIFCGMGIGYVDEAAPVNGLVSERAPIEDYVTFHGAAAMAEN